MSDQPALVPSQTAPQSPPYNAAVEAILLDLFPLKPLRDLASVLTNMKGQREEASSTKEFDARVQTQRAKLLDLPESELNKLHLQLQAKQKNRRDAQAIEEQARQKAKAADKEAARFYNQANARADFDHWLKMDYWTREESVALLLGRNPQVVTTAAMKREMEPGLEALLLSNKRPPPSEFIQQYQRLKMMADRADALQLPKLKPLAVIAWAQRTQSLELPPVLIQVLQQQVSVDAGKSEQTLPVASPSNPNGGTPKKWTAEKLSELAAHLAKFGPQATALAFEISTGRIRQLLPKKASEKQAKKPRPRGMWEGL